MAFVVSGLGLASALPATAAVADRCDGDFPLQDSEVLAQDRNLDPQETIVGEITLDSSDSDRTLHVDLKTNNRELDFHVFREDNGCDSYATTDADCEGEITKKNADSDTGCVMQAPGQGSVTYNVNFWNNGTQSLEFKTWAP